MRLTPILLFALSLMPLMAEVETTTSTNNSKMVFLVESKQGKHIGLSTNFKNYHMVTQGANWHIYPSISSDAKHIAYIKGTSTDDLTLIYQELSSGQEIPLSTPGFVLHPQFAKNDRLLFFSIKKGEVNRIGFVNLNEIANGGGLPQLQLVPGTHSSFFPSPFQNGELVIYQRNSEQKEIVLHNLLNNEVTVIGYGMSPSLSKDERFIAYTSKTGGNWNIFVYDRFKKSTKQVTTHPKNDLSPAFDNNNDVLYTSDRLEKGVFSIYRQTFESWSKNKGKALLQISQPGVSFYAPRIAGDAATLLSPIPAMPGEARSSFGAIAHQQKFFIVGGHQGPEHTYPPESFTGRMDMFDWHQQQWSSLAPRPKAAQGFGIIAHDDFIYAFGGFAYNASTSPAWQSLSQVDRYHIKTNTWEQVAIMPRKRSSNVVAQVANKVYLIGGWDATPKYQDDIDGTFHDTIDVFDLNTEKWETLKVKLPKKRRAFSALVRGKKIYLIGGISEGGSHFSLLNDFTEFNTEDHSFRELPKLHFPTFAPAAGGLGNKAFVFGGMFKNREIQL